MTTARCGPLANDIVPPANRVHRIGLGHKQ